MPVASLEEVEAQRVVGGVGAAVGREVEGRWVVRVARGLELLNGFGEQAGGERKPEAEQGDKGGFRTGCP